MTLEAEDSKRDTSLFLNHVAVKKLFNFCHPIYICLNIVFSMERRQIYSCFFGVRRNTPLSLVWGDCLGKGRCKSFSSPLRSWWCLDGGWEDLGEARWVCGGFLNCSDIKCKLAYMAAIWALMSLTSLVSLWSIRGETSPSSSALVLCCVRCGEFCWVCTLARVALLVLMIDMIKNFRQSVNVSLKNTSELPGRRGESKKTT